MDATMTDAPTTPDVRWDGDTDDVAGHTYTLRVLADDMTIMDEQGAGVWCGRLEWVDTRGRDGNRAPRPATFTGNAEILERDGSYVCWWEPEPDVKRADRESFAAYRRSVLDTLRDGYSLLVLESDDGYSDAVGGIAGLDAECTREMVAEMYANICDDRDAATLAWWDAVAAWWQS